MKLPPETPLGTLPWISKPRLTALRKLGIESLGDLALHFPRRHEDRSRFSRFPIGATADPVLIRGDIVKVGFLPFGKWRRGFEATIQESGGDALSGQVVLRWFNMPHISKAVSVGFSIVAYGKTKLRGRKVLMDFPDYELVEEGEGEGEETLIHLNRIVPIHPAGEGVSAKKLRELIYRALQETDLTSLPTILPGAQDGADRAVAIHDIHFPASAADLAAARERLVFEEFFQIQALLASRRAEIAAAPLSAKKTNGRLLAVLSEQVAFSPTGAQERAIASIREGMEAPSRMHRLLQGDVGSGKTFVAAAAAMNALESGCRVALLAPTQILAEQHWRTFRKWMEPLGIQIALRTGTRSEALAPNEPTLFDTPVPSPCPLPEGPQIVVGTHALLYGDVTIENLGLIIIDEQHKFGVMQRAKLANAHPQADILVLTATPIPRTLAQTAYGDLEVTVLDELPPGRGKIITGVRPASKLNDAAKFIRAQVEAGRQAFIVYPLIDESEKVAAKAAREEYEKWCVELTPIPCGLLHGRMDTAEKHSTMEAFRRHETHVLIATTVIEVGIDVPNATVMLIENAERFGLAQLHQLRGRVGRGAHTSYCILIPGNADPDVIDRLRILETTTDGFAVAEADLKLRGPGDILGIAQTGLPPLRLGDLSKDASILQASRTLAQKIFQSDPTLAQAEHSHLRDWIQRRLTLLELADG